VYYHQVYQVASLRNSPLFSLLGNQLGSHLDNLLDSLHHNLLDVLHHNHLDSPHLSLHFNLADSLLDNHQASPVGCLLHNQLDSLPCSLQRNPQDNLLARYCTNIFNHNIYHSLHKSAAITPAISSTFIAAFTPTNKNSYKLSVSAAIKSTLFSADSTAYL
jgi:hypothetical protein